ncbi:hypothetical protein ACFL67_00645 [candidate division KSB1 bacterium]
MFVTLFIGKSLMNQVLNMFSPESNDFELTGIETLAKALRYHPDRENRFLSGLLFAEDLKSDQEVTLHTAGTPVTFARISRLLRLQENKPEWNLHIKLRRSAQLVQSFRDDIAARLKKLYKFKQKYNVYNSLLNSIEREFESIIEAILLDQNFTLELYKMKYISDSSEVKDSGQFFNHTASVALFAFAVAKEKALARKIKFSRDEYRDLMQAAFFHNIGAVLEVDSILQAFKEKREKLYHKANRTSAAVAKNIKIGNEALKAIKYVNGYSSGSTGFTAQENSSDLWMANIILVADKYLQLECGLFHDRLKPSQIIDSLNVQAVNGKLNQNVVNAITNGLGLEIIADFYKEIEKIRSTCKFSGGGHAWPYPVKGFKSPTLFVCKEEKHDCKYFESSVKAVSLLQPMGLLKEGSYSRCKLATQKLLQYYKDNKMKKKTR